MRLPRLDYPGARHHVMNRGGRHERVFFDEESYALFLRLVADLPGRFGVRVHGYALMPNHYHLMLETVTGDLPRAMRHIGGEYTQRVNRRFGWDGAIFRGRYRNRLVGTDAYWRHLLAYLHLNPARANLSAPEVAKWTSHRSYLGAEPRPKWLTTSQLRALFGSESEYIAYHQALLEDRAAPPDDFDEEKLWLPDSTGAVAVPPFRDEVFAVADALAEVSAVTGVELEQVIVTRQGRAGNPANWLAAWWMSRRRGIDQGTIARVLGTSHSAVSRRVRRVEERRHGEGQLREWVAKLERAKDKT